jgi:serine phosphatase RsbU (regulator of sigma subunit)
VGYTEEEKPFEEVEIDLRSRLPVMVYGFTDGIVDQMGGPKGRKLLPKGLKEILLGLATLSCPEQAQKLRTFFAEWKSERHQLDDVTLIGVHLV